MTHLQFNKGNSGPQLNLNIVYDRLESRRSFPPLVVSQQVHGFLHGLEGHHWPSSCIRVRHLLFFLRRCRYTTCTSYFTPTLAPTARSVSQLEELRGPTHGRTDGQTSSKKALNVGSPMNHILFHNYFNFMEFYKVMADNNHSQWDQDGRVQMGTTDFERRLDNMMAYYEGQIRESQQRQKESEQRQKENQEQSEQRQKDLDKTAATAANLANWGRYMREGFEYVAQDVLAEKLKARGYTDLLCGQ